MKHSACPQNQEEHAAARQSIRTAKAAAKAIAKANVKAAKAAAKEAKATAKAEASIQPIKNKKDHEPQRRTKNNPCII